MQRITVAVALVGLAGGCGSADAGSSASSARIESDTSRVGSSPGDTPSAPAINGGAASGPAIGGGTAPGPSVGAGGIQNGPAVNGGTVSSPAVGSGAGGGGGASCADVGAYIQSMGHVPAACLSCLTTSCCGALLGCYKDPSCLSYAQCAGTCNASASSSGASPSCNCDSQYPTGASAYNEYANCAITTCASACVMVTTSSSGGTSSGGTSNGGGSSGGSCLGTAVQCSQGSDCCSGICTTYSSSGSTIGFCQ